MTVRLMLEIASLFSEGRDAVRKDIEENIEFPNEDAKYLAVARCGTQATCCAMAAEMEEAGFGIQDLPHTLAWVQSFSKEMSGFHKMTSFPISGGEAHKSHGR